MGIYSTGDQLARLQRVLFMCLRLPFSQGAIAGRVLEEALANVRSAEVLNTYDFVDVVSKEDACGWQVKSTRHATPVTWKRAKLPDAAELIDASLRSATACQELGDAIIHLCNEHARSSLAQYDLREIGYARLILHEDRKVTYFEKDLCSTDSPDIFDPKDFCWRWSTPRPPAKKEQLPALHGIHRETNRRWWAWHGRGENQLHFSGESAWWPTDSRHSFSFDMPSTEELLTIDALMTVLKEADLDS